MSGLARIAAFVVGLTALAAVAALVGRAADVAPRTVDGPSAGHGGSGGAMAADAPVGLSVSEGGLVLVPATTSLPAGQTTQLAFHVARADGSPVTGFDLEHERRMHVVVVRRDLSGFQHLHPRLRGDGTWVLPLRVEEPGAYRLLADFSTDGVRRVLGVDLTADGAAVRHPLPAPSAATVVAGRRVRLAVDGGAAGEETRFRFLVERDGRPVVPDPYLGARGHLVVLREGDLAYVHAHAVEGGTGAEVVFESTLPSAGRYALFLQVSDGGEIVTAPFTHEVAP